MASAVSEDSVRTALQRLLTSKYFAQAESLSNLLTYLVEETLAGHGPELKEFTLGSVVFGRGDSFDPKTDGIVRVQASRLRTKLRDYYAAEGRHDETVISVPTGGYIAEFQSNGHALPTKPPRVWPKHLTWVGAAAALAVVMLWLGSNTRTNPSPKIESVAVLPFRNLTGDPSQAYLADGLTDMLITDLGKGLGLRVISRTTAMTFAGSNKSLTTVANELKVDKLVEGSMTRAGENIRVNVTIIEVHPQERNLWNRTFEHNARSFPVLQGEINRQVAAQFHDAKIAPPAAIHQSNPDAYAAYLKGRQMFGQHTEAGLRESIQWFAKASELDPNMAAAKANHALSYVFLSDFYMSPAESLSLAKPLATSALQLDPSLSDAYTARGAVELMFDHDVQAAETDLRHAIQLNPGSVEAHFVLALLCGAMGRFDEAIASLRRGVEHDPFSPKAHMMFLWMHLLAGRYKDVQNSGQAALLLFPNHPIIQLWVGSSLALQGNWQKASPYFESASNLHQLPMAPIFVGLMHAVNRDKPAAKAQLAKAHQIGKKRYICAYEVASVHSVLGEMDEAYKWMERALVERCMCLNWLMTEKWMQSFRDDPRFPALVAKVGLWNKAHSF